MTDHVYDPATRSRYITTFTGKNIGPPGIFTYDQVDIRDIRRALSMQCRFYGHLDRFYSVAEHSVLVSEIAERLGDHEAVLPALLHDAHEAYTGDLASPQKSMVPGWEQFEVDMERIVRRGLNIADTPLEVWQRVRQYDLMILHREISTLRKATLPDWHDPQQEALLPPGILPVGFMPEEAEAMFRRRFNELVAPEPSVG